MNDEPSPDNLEEVMDDIRHEAAGIRDELLERLEDAGSDDQVSDEDTAEL